MLNEANVRDRGEKSFPKVLSVKEQSELVTEAVRERLDTILPTAMDEAGLDVWIILCQEDDLDPIYRTMVPMDCWSPILQMIIFVDEGRGRIKRYNISMTDTKDLYDRPYSGPLEENQWVALVDLVVRRNPETIGVNIGSIKWAAGGLTYNLYRQLEEKLPIEYSRRLVSAEKAAIRWASTLTNKEMETYRQVVEIAHAIIADTYSPTTIEAGVTTTDDLKWHYWQRVYDLGLDVAFRPSFRIVRDESSVDFHEHEDNVIRPGDMIHCDVGIRYLRLNSDNQHLAYVLNPGETDAPPGLISLMTQTNKLQDIFAEEFKRGLSGNDLHRNIQQRARKEGVTSARIYSHSLGLFLHQPGPLIGLPWEQEKPLRRGETRIEHNYAFAMELSIDGIVPEWNDQTVRCCMEEPVVFTVAGCSPVCGRQTEYYLI